MWGFVLLSMVVGYLCGCFQTAYLIGKWNHIDIRDHGSGNAGTTNTLRTLGKMAALFTFLGDVFKGILGVLLARYVFAPLIPDFDSQLLCLLTGFCVVLGHNFPFYLHFKGGKGIATTGAVTLAFHPILGLVSAILFFGLCAATRYVSLASLVMVLAFPINIILVYHSHPDFVSLLLVSLCYTLLAFIRHKANIVRLLHGTENRLGGKKNQ